METEGRTVVAPGWAGSRDLSRVGMRERFRVMERFENWEVVMTAAAKSLQLCPTRCDPMDGSPPGSPVPGILQARTLEWVAISFSSA